MEEIIQDIIASLKSMAQAERIAFAKVSYPTSMEILGVTNPDARKVMAELKTITKVYSGQEKLLLAKALAGTGIFECQHLALEYVGKDKKALRALTASDVEDFCTHMDNWVSVDCYGAYIVGYAWREGIIDTSRIKAFQASEDFWMRRVALVAAVSLNQKARGGTGDAPRTLEICAGAVDDHADMINKALSWALRELAKIDKEPVEAFLAEYEEHLHKRVLREVRNKLKTGLKKG